jgi:flavin reductase (DIM6/NTAB) family NADH-FMN oxidoreductase RutF
LPRRALFAAQSKKEYAMTPDTSPDDFRAAMRGFMGHVSLVTVGETGLVVTSATSLSAEPPMILFCINRTSSTWPVLQSEGRFGWSALGAAHQAVAERFSGRTGVSVAERYAGAKWDEMAGVRLLVGAPLAFACEVTDMIDKSTHSIVIGQVIGITTSAGAGALAYHQGAYVTL